RLEEHIKNVQASGLRDSFKLVPVGYDKLKIE
ncbi:hypothetical protein DBR06_SOUSAS210411, partial [Sousa chinensis]